MCILTAAGRRGNGPKFGHQGKNFGVCRVLLTVKCPWSVKGHSMNFRFCQFSVTWYLENGWSDQNLDLGQVFIVFVYRVRLIVNCSRSFGGHSV